LASLLIRVDPSYISKKIVEERRITQVADDDLTISDYLK